MNFSQNLCQSTKHSVKQRQCIPVSMAWYGTMAQYGT